MIGAAPGQARNEPTTVYAIPWYGTTIRVQISPVPALACPGDSQTDSLRAEILPAHVQASFHSLAQLGAMSKRRAVQRSQRARPARVNYGYVYEVVSVTPTGRTSVTVVSRDARTGIEYWNRRQADRLIGIAR